MTYVSTTAFNLWLGDDVNSTTDAAVRSAVLSAVDLAIETYCGRTFVADASDTARYFRPADAIMVEIDDCYSITSVAVDDGDTGAWGTTWAATDYVTLPLNGVGPHGRTGWPTTGLQAVYARYFPIYIKHPAVKVTGKWGWSAVPDDVVLAAKLLASELYNAKNAPFGSGGVAEFGPTLIRGNARIAQLLAPYQRTSALGGRFLVS